MKFLDSFFTSLPIKQSTESKIIFLALGLATLFIIFKFLSNLIKTFRNKKNNSTIETKPAFGQELEEDLESIERNIESESMNTTDKDNDEKILLMESTVNSILDSIIISTSSGVIIDFNPASEDMFGFTKEEVIGKSINKIMPIEVAEKHDIFLKNFINTNNDLDVKITREIVCKRKDDSKFFAHISISLFKTSSEIYFVALIRDINEKKMYEEKINEAMKKSAEASNTKQMFLASMSHELRTPLNAVIGMSEVLKETSLDSEQEKYVGSILKSGKNLLAIINDILDISKIEANELKLENVKVSLEDLISDVVDMLSIHAYDKGLELTYFVDQNIKKYILADPVRLSQVIINLTNNAIKFTPKGEVSIQVKALNNTGKILFEIIDTGIGIKEENQSKIFQSFTQEDDSTTRVYGGTGLGLQISNSLVQIMGGKIDVTSKIDVGSKFFFTLQFETAEDLPKTSHNIKGKFLFICDNLSLRSLIRKYIEELKLSAAVKTIDEFKVLITKGSLSKELKPVILVSNEDNLDFKVFNTLIKKGVDRHNIALGVRINDLNKTKVKALNQGVKNIVDIPVRKSVLISQLENIGKGRTLEKANVTNEKRAMIVDDDEGICMALELELEHPNIKIETYSDPREAVKALENQVYDIVISDYNMPNINGESLYRSFKQSNSTNSPFILISGDLEGLPSDLIRQVIFMHKPLKMNFFKQIFFDSLKLTPNKEVPKTDSSAQMQSSAPQERKDLKSQTNQNSETKIAKNEILDNPAKVLIVDDSEENQALMKAYLKKANVVLKLANNGQEAVDLAKKENFDLIFMDMQMPIMDGLTATKELRKLNIKYPIMALTANVFEEEKASALAAGCSEYIAKPVSKKKIIEIIENIRSSK